MPVGPRRDAAPANDPRIELPLFVQETAGGWVDGRVLEVALVAIGLEGVALLLNGLGVGMVGEDDVRVIGQPLAGFDKGELEAVHHQVDGTSMGFAHIAFEAVLADMEVEAWVTVVMKWALGLVTGDRKPQPRGHSLDGERPELSELGVSNS